MLVLLVLTLVFPASADTISIPERTVERLANSPRLTSENSSRAPCVDNQPCTVFALTPSLPVTFYKLEFESEDTKRVNRDLAIGAGATFFIARGTYQADTGASGERRYRIEDAVTQLFLGAAGQVGTSTGLDGEVDFGVSGSAFIGTRCVALVGGYDATNRTPFIGLAANLLGTSVSPRAAAVFSAWQ